MRLSAAAVLLIVAWLPAPPAPTAEAPVIAELRIGGGEVEIALDPASPVPPDAIVAWTRDAAEAVSAYYGRFPVPRLRVEFVVDDGDGHLHGREAHGDSIRMRVGRRATAATLRGDWRMTHEMVHLAFPDLDERYLWMEEGLATYLEPIARCRLGQLDEERVWRDLVEGLPKGLPAAGDSGLDRTPTWGRTYWGGALFWLEADIEIRERSDGRKSLRDALRAILAAGGNNGSHWPIERVIAVGDAATGYPVLAELHRRLGLQPTREDLDALWSRLGVIYRDGRATFDDAAPEAWIRRAITGPDAVSAETAAARPRGE